MRDSLAAALDPVRGGRVIGIVTSGRLITPIGGRGLPDVARLTTRW